MRSAPMTRTISSPVSESAIPLTTSGLRTRSPSTGAQTRIRARLGEALDPDDEGEPETPGDVDGATIGVGDPLPVVRTSAASSNPRVHAAVARSRMSTLACRCIVSG